jgi:(1->4)-alpha-D-glucan 1-alpha-D-glucosylmutase
VLTGRRYAGGAIRLAELLATYPVALLAPADPEETTTR